MSLSFFTAGKRGSYAIKTPSFEVEEGGYRRRPPSVWWFGGSCSSIVALTTSLIKAYIPENIRVVSDLLETLTLNLLRRLLLLGP